MVENTNTAPQTELQMISNWISKKYVCQFPDWLHLFIQQMLLCKETYKWKKHNKQCIIRVNDIYTMPDLTRLVASSTNAKVWVNDLETKTNSRQKKRGACTI